MADAIVIKSLLLGLQQDTALMALVSGVYETPPPTADTPYISLNRLRLSDASTKTSAHYDVAADLTVWDETSSSKTARAIVDRLREIVPQIAAQSGVFTDLHVVDTDLARDHNQTWVRARVSLNGLYTGG